MTADFRSAAEEILRAALEDFAEWMAKNWQTTPAEARQLCDETSSPAEYARGYNAGVESVPLALRCWLDEYDSIERQNREGK